MAAVQLLITLLVSLSLVFGIPIAVPEDANTESELEIPVNNKLANVKMH